MDPFIPGREARLLIAAYSNQHGNPKYRFFAESWGGADLPAAGQTGLAPSHERISPTCKYSSFVALALRRYRGGQPLEA
jgi:hypothetical protein